MPSKTCFYTVQYGVAVCFSINDDGVQHIREPCSRQPLDISSAKTKKGQDGGKTNACYFTHIGKKQRQVQLVIINCVVNPGRL